MRGILTIILFATVVLQSCTSTKYVPVETVRTEYKDNVREVFTTDSVVDTRFVYINGDTVIDYRDRVKWRDRFVHDSVYIEKSDTIRIPYPVEKQLTRWQQTKMDLGGLAIGALVFALCVAICWLIKKAKR